MSQVKEKSEYFQQKLREYIYYKAKKERIDMYKFCNWDLIDWCAEDEVWIDNRIMQLCEENNIIPW
jgi:hypothetical protein